MVILGVLLVVVTLMYPPYYGRGGADESDTSICKSNDKSGKSDQNNTSDASKGRRCFDRTSANRLRLAIDLGMLWTYICALVAILLHTSTSHEFHDGNTLFSHSAVFLLECYLVHVSECAARGALNRHA